jgi:hypothetical protein
MAKEGLDKYMERLADGDSESGLLKTLNAKGCTAPDSYFPQHTLVAKLGGHSLALRLRQRVGSGFTKDRAFLSSSS